MQSYKKMANVFMHQLGKFIWDRSPIDFDWVALAFGEHLVTERAGGAGATKVIWKSPLLGRGVWRWLKVVWMRGVRRYEIAFVDAIY